MKERKNSKARIAANNRYTAKAYDRINIAVPKGMKELAVKHAQRTNCSVNAMMNRLLMMELGLTEQEWKSIDKGIATDAGQDE